MYYKMILRIEIHNAKNLESTDITGKYLWTGMAVLQDDNIKNWRATTKSTMLSC